MGRLLFRYMFYEHGAVFGDSTLSSWPALGTEERGIVVRLWDSHTDRRFHLHAGIHPGLPEYVFGADGRGSWNLETGMMWEEGGCW